MSTEELAKKIRLHTVNMTSRGNSSHVGSGLSIADILAVLYGKVMNIDPANPEMPSRDRFILSKGHAGAALYATLAEVGYFPTSELKNHYQDGSLFSGHVSHKGIPGVEFSTGSLGHGLPVAGGRAYALKKDSHPARVFTILSDGECDEGSNWEAALFAAHHKLDNLVAIIDYNKLQSLTSVSETLELEPFTDKWKSFGWEVKEVNGHDHEEIEGALGNLPLSPSKPSVVIAHTTKGKGVSFMENSVLWHYRSPQESEYSDAIKELEKNA